MGLLLLSRSLAGLAFLLGALGCSGDDPIASPTPTLAPPIATATPIPTPTPRPAPPRPDAQPFPEDLRLSSQQLFERIAALRNTPIKESVDMFLLSRDQARAFYARPAPELAPTAASPAAGPPPIDPRQEVYELLGLVPEQAAPGQPSLEQAQTDNLISLITGFYSPPHRAFYMLDSLSGGPYGSLASSTIVHELTHALQYQYADIDSIASARANDWDATTALFDVLEGDAVYAEIAALGFSTRSTYRQPVCFTIPAPLRAGTPYVVERDLDTWYEDGLCFVQAVAAERGLAGLFDNLPATTEQVLHPEKYFAGEGAKPVTLPSLTAALGPGWRHAAGGRFGEFLLQNVLLAGLPEDRAAVQAGAAGWGGDAWALYVDAEARLLQVSLTWDTAEDAEEFWSVLLGSLRARGAEGVAEGAPVLQTDVAGKTWVGRLEGSNVLLVVSNDAEAARRAAGSP